MQEPSTTTTLEASLMRFEIIPQEQTPIIPPFTEDVKEYLSKNRLLVDKFLDFCRKHDNAVGLAGNQLSLNGERFMHRIFGLRYGWPHQPNNWMLVVDPVIKEYLGVKRLKQEGCLTWGDYNSVIAERSPAIRVSYYTDRGIFVDDEIIRGFMAQVWQHEVNHLNGVPEEIKAVTNHKKPGEKIKLNLPKPVLDRNMICPCGSGKKFKNCCIKWEN